MHWIDIDDIRFTCFGPPNPYPATEQELEKDRAEMLGSYRMLFAATTANLQMGRSLIISATFSRKSYWLELLASIPRHPIKVIWCRPQNDTDEEISARLARRRFGENCWSSVNTLDRYKEVKGRFQAPTLPHLTLDTSPPNSVEDCVARAIEYLRT